MALPDEGWIKYGLCARTNLTEIFFPEGPTEDPWSMDRRKPPHPGYLADSYRKARALCSACPVQTECLEHALSQNEIHHGIWGGYSPRDRRRLKAGQTPKAPLVGACAVCGWRDCRCVSGEKVEIAVGPRRRRRRDFSQRRAG